MMLFWIVLYSSLFCLFLMGIFISGSKKNIVIKCFLFIIWFIASFRYMIGVDYAMYMDFYINDSFVNVFQMEDNNAELFPVVLTIVLKNLGFGSQMFFLVYASVILFFLYAGIKRYTTNKTTVLLVLVLYTMMNIPGTYYWSMNAIRQATAISVVFWGSFYFFDKQYLKAVLSLILASFFHFSAFLFLPILGVVSLLVRIELTKKKILLSLLIASFMTLTSISAKIGFYLLKNIPMYSEKYAGVLKMVSENIVPSFTLTAILLMFFLPAVYRYCGETKKYKIDDMLFASALLFILLRILTSFQLSINNNVMADVLQSMIHRVDAYLVLFYIFVMAEWLTSFFYNKKNIMNGLIISSIIILIFGIHSLRQFYIADTTPNTSPVISAGNINYEFRFDLFNN